MAQQKTNDFATVSPPGQKPVVTSIFDFSADALAQLRLWLEQNPPAVPITSVLGFSQFTAEPGNYIDTQESLTTNGSYLALATDGPTISGLSDGKYIFLYGAIATGGNNNWMGIRVNTTDPVDADACFFVGGTGVTSVSSRATVATLSGGSNTVVCRYKTDAQPASWRKRWLIALRYANK